ncbi:MAG: hypothetical protein GEV28_31720 [Actinophytocola sp.]|uniref:Imm1 family immunity protein n=1 Tax=Actinophytocola sp. TaxID=1872138 RepID=UPI001321C4CF|nr:Imm1 family immunity protein [Actinophytocola sp.]MPZ84707.1 hypothetical protein [Actinophytocola sp.]
MTAADERHLVSVRFDERSHEWRIVASRSKWPALVEEILTPPPADCPQWVLGLRTVAVGTSADPSEGKTLFLVSVGPGVAAAYYRDMPDGAAHGWVTHNPHPLVDAPELAFSSQGWNTFPSKAVLHTDEVRPAISEFLTTGRRPECIEWQQSEWIQ